MKDPPNEEIRGQASIAANLLAGANKNDSYEKVNQNESLIIIFVNRLFI